jgi:hypothetical protein
MGITVNKILMRNRKMKKQLRADPNDSFAFVIPDTGGHNYLLNLVLQQILAGKHWPLAKNDSVVFMGQYVGPEMSKVIDSIRAFTKKVECHVTCLVGPDDLKFMNAREQFFKTKEGLNTVMSYRTFFKNAHNHPREGFVNVEKMQKDRNWLAKNHTFFTTDNLFICYGGIDPAHPIEKQNVGSLAFNHLNKSVSDAFLKNTSEYENIIVHSGYKTMSKPITITSDEGTVQRVNVNSCVDTTGYLNCSVINTRTGEVVNTIGAYDTKKWPAWKEANLTPLNKKASGK